MKLQYFGYLMWRASSLEKTLMLGKIEDRRRGWQRLRWLNVITDSMDMRLSNLCETLKDWEAWRAEVCGVTESDTTDWLNNNNIIESYRVVSVSWKPSVFCQFILWEPRFKVIFLSDSFSFPFPFHFPVFVPFLSFLFLEMIISWKLWKLQVYTYSSPTLLKNFNFIGL